MWTWWPVVELGNKRQTSQPHILGVGGSWCWWLRDGGWGNSFFELFSTVSHIQIISSYDILPQMVKFINYLLTLTIYSCRRHGLCIGVSSCFKAKMSLMTLF